MHSIKVLPHPVLQPYIQAYLYTEMMGTGKVNVDIYPIGNSVISFILNERPFVRELQHYSVLTSRFNFTGQLTSYRSLEASAASMVNVLFKPLGPYRLFGIPQYHFMDDCFSMDELMGNAISELVEKMEEFCMWPMKIIALLEEWFLQQWTKNERFDSKQIDFACQRVLNDKGSIAIKDLYTILGMSKSSLESHFKQKVGLSPKVYSRVIRFNHALSYIQQNEKTDWHELVYKCNFFDQSHFIHEFKAFFGYTPSQVHLSNRNLALHFNGALND